MKADPIFAVSYMPLPFDAVRNDDRQSAPKDYSLWEDLCYRAAKRCVDRNRRIPFWEVWNEVNSGWLKPGPDDKGDQPFKDIYKQALDARLVKLKPCGDSRPTASSTRQPLGACFEPIPKRRSAGRRWPAVRSSPSSSATA
jgi:hypothetical protein